MWAFLVINMTCSRKRDQLLRTLFEMNFCYNCAGDCFCCNYAVRGFCSTYAGDSFCSKYVGDSFYCNYGVSVTIMQVVFSAVHYAHDPIVIMQMTSFLAM